jgi:hypothetical protein
MKLAPPPPRLRLTAGHDPRLSRRPPCSSSSKRRRDRTPRRSSSHRSSRNSSSGCRLLSVDGRGFPSRRACDGRRGRRHRERVDGCLVLRPESRPKEIKEQEGGEAFSPDHHLLTARLQLEQEWPPSKRPRRPRLSPSREAPRWSPSSSSSLSFVSAFHFLPLTFLLFTPAHADEAVIL